MKNKKYDKIQGCKFRLQCNIISTDFNNSAILTTGMADIISVLSKDNFLKYTPNEKIKSKREFREPA